jgi:hypothetical protein
MEVASGDGIKTLSNLKVRSLNRIDVVDVTGSWIYLWVL